MKEQTLEKHPTIKNQLIDPDKYYGSDLNKLVGAQCRKDIMVMNIDLIISDYKGGYIKIVESKHSFEKIGKGQDILLRQLSQMGIDTFVVSGDTPFKSVKVFSYQTNRTVEMNNNQLTKFLNNEQWRTK